MPLIQFFCPIERKTVPLDHFDHCVAWHGQPACSPFVASSVAAKARDDVRHQRLAITVTSAMDCPRRVFLERTQSYAIDPNTMVRAARGTALHSEMIASLSAEEYITEKSDPMRAEVEGTLFGVPISGKLDVLKVTDGKITKIIDAKFPSDFSVKWRPKPGQSPRAEHLAQLNMLRLLLDQQDWTRKEYKYDAQTVDMVIWDHAVGSSEGPTPARANPKGIDHWNEEQVGSVRPWGSEHTIKEHATVLHAAFTAMKENAAHPQAADEIGARLPLWGRTMLRSKDGRTKCSTCDLRTHCDRLLTAYGEPQV